MRITGMTASFGRLQGEVLTPGPGLTVIHAPNEGGKSTWCAFLRAMLYGMDTRERDTKSTPAEKNRWQPWSGAPMEGELALSWKGRELLLRRFPKGGVPFGGFSAVDAATGEAVPGLTGGTAGEALLGVSRRVYERSAFISQGAMSFTGEPELEKRIAALVSSGEEAVSYSQAEARLKEWQRRRKYNKAGLIPRLETELGEIVGTLARMESAQTRQAEALEAIKRLEPRQRELEAERALQSALAGQALNRRRQDALAAFEQAREQEFSLTARIEALDRTAEADPLFSGASPEDAWCRANGDALAVTSHRKAAGLKASLLILLGAFSAAVLFWLSLTGAPLRPWLCLLGLLPMAAGLWLAGRHRSAAARLLARYGAKAPADMLARASDYREKLLRQETRRREAQAALDTAAARREGARRLLDVLSSGGQPPAPPPVSGRTPARIPEETDRLLAEVRETLGRLSGDLATARGELNTLGSPAALEARREELREELARRRREYDAIAVALEELSLADGELRARFSPALNKRAGELLAALTGGAYESVALSRDFQAMAGAAGGILPRQSALLSRGTADQLYLAVRLAVCQLALPGDEPAPLVLDDALAFFDNERAALALDLLHRLGEERQILLFTCHSRESDYFAGTPGVTLIHLQ